MNQKSEGLMASTTGSLKGKKDSGSRNPAEGDFQRIVEGINEGVIIVNTGGIICYVNPIVESLFLRSKKELLGEVFGFPIKKDGGTTVTIHRKGGEMGRGEMHVNEIQWAGEKANLVKISDTTELKEAETKLKKRVEELEKFNKLVVGRELRMQELKKEVDDLLKKLGRGPKYVS